MRHTIHLPPLVKSVYNNTVQIILTKCDLLVADDLARSITVVYDDMLNSKLLIIDAKKNGLEMDDEGESESDGDSDSEIASEEMKIVHDLSDISHALLPVSSSTGANITLLWNDLCACAEETSQNPNTKNLKNVLREHTLAHQQRRQALLKQTKVDNKKSRRKKSSDRKTSKANKAKSES